MRDIHRAPVNDRKQRVFSLRIIEPDFPAPCGTDGLSTAECDELIVMEAMDELDGPPLHLLDQDG